MPGTGQPSKGQKKEPLFMLKVFKFLMWSSLRKSTQIDSILLAF